MNQIHNRKELFIKRRKLRNNSTEAERLLWSKIKGKALSGFKFRRQHSVGNYILDFYCPAKRIAVEIDGGHHYTEDVMEYDMVREEYLNTLNIKVLRFINEEVFHNLEAVLMRIMGELTTP